MNSWCKEQETEQYNRCSEIMKWNHEITNEIMKPQMKSLISKSCMLFDRPPVGGYVYYKQTCPKI